RRNCRASEVKETDKKDARKEKATCSLAESAYVVARGHSISSHGSRRTRHSREDSEKFEQIGRLGVGDIDDVLVVKREALRSEEASRLAQVHLEYHRNRGTRMTREIDTHSFEDATAYDAVSEDGLRLRARVNEPAGLCY